MSHEHQLEELFRQLHEELVTRLLNKLREGDPPASIVKEARELLKDNGITDAGKRLNSPIRRLASELPKFDDESRAL